MSKTTFIYGLEDPRDQQIYYIGKSNHPKIRLQQHLIDRTTNASKAEWIAELHSEGLTPKLVILDEIPIEKWPEREAEWITSGYDQGWPLLNIVMGGKEEPGRSPKEDFSFMRRWIGEDLWPQFEELAIDEKNDICAKTAQAVAAVRLPVLKYKIETEQQEMVPINIAELVQVGIKAAEAALLNT